MRQNFKNIPPMGLMEFLSAGEIERYHILPDVPAQSNAQHSYNVALIAWVILEDVVAEVDTTWHRRLQKMPEIMSWLLKEALVHDSHELYTGDIPSPAKTLLGVRDTEAAIKEVATGWVNHEERASTQNDTIFRLIHQVIKLADLMEGYRWIMLKGAPTSRNDKACKYMNILIKRAMEHFSGDVEIFPNAFKDDEHIYLYNKLQHVHHDVVCGDPGKTLTEIDLQPTTEEDDDEIPF